MPQGAREITQLLIEWRRGSQSAGDELMQRVYPELRRLAAQHLRRRRPNATLQPTELVHELYVRMLASTPITLQDRAHFYAIAAQQLRRILIDYVRAARAAKRGGEQLRVTLTDAPQPMSQNSDSLLALDEALTRLEKMDARAARLVELRFFGGLRDKEAAEALHISIATVKRDWTFARAWLSSQLASAPGAVLTAKG